MIKEENPELFEWLQNHWRTDNHVKYQKYFSEWVSNVTEDQINGFIHLMECEKENKFVKH